MLLSLGMDESEFRRPDFRPRQVRLEGWPFGDTFGRLESEAAATVIVRVLQHLGDTWMPVYPEEIRRLLWHDMQHKVEPIYSLAGNPFWRADYQELADSGYAVIHDDGSVEFTLRGIEQLRKYVRNT